MIELREETFFRLYTIQEDEQTLESIASAHYGREYRMFANPYDDSISNGTLLEYSYADAKSQEEFYEEVTERQESLDEWLAVDSGTAGDASPHWQHMLTQLIDDKVLPEGKYLLDVSW